MRREPFSEGQNHQRPRLLACHPGPVLGVAPSQASFFSLSPNHSQGLATPWPSAGTQYGGPSEMEWDRPPPAHSPGSYENSSTIFGSYATTGTGPTASLARGRHISPDTPTHSTVSNDNITPRQAQGDGAFGLANRSWADYSRPQGQQLTEDVVGIETPNDAPTDVNRYVGSPVECASSQSLRPNRPQRFPGQTEPWTVFNLRQDSFAAFPDLATIHETSHHQWTPQALPGPGDRVPGRKGPLSNEQKKKAGDVRKVGACLRCYIMREGCDAEVVPCQRCEAKENRKWNLPCIRMHSDAEAYMTCLLPEVLRHRLNREEVNKYIERSMYFYNPSPSFTIPLRMRHFHHPLKVKVKEYYPIDTELSIRPAFQTVRDPRGNRTGLVNTWNPPITLYLKDGDREVEKIRCHIRGWFHQVFQEKDNPYPWPWACLDDDEEDWQAEMVVLMHQYYQEHIPQHHALKVALSLLFFNHLLIQTFYVPPDAIHHLQSHLEAEPPRPVDGVVCVVPATVNRFLKMIVLPVALEAARKSLERLHDLLLKIAIDGNGSMARNDLAFCLAFLILIFLGRTQSAVLQLSTLDPADTGVDFSFDEARTLITEMEEKLGKYVILFHDYGWKKRSKPSSSPTEDFDDAERHARSFCLIEKMRQVTSEKFEHQRPTTFDVPELNIETFGLWNTHRLCWKLFNNVEREPKPGGRRR